jgi:hypothetical protein
MYVDRAEIACCGIREIQNLSIHKAPETAMLSFVEQTSPEESYYDNSVLERRDKFRYAIFSGTKRSRYVDRFAAYILSNKLGEVVETGWNKNPNSGNQLKVCVWTINWDALKKWAAKQEGNDGKGKPSAPVAPADIT